MRARPVSSRTDTARLNPTQPVPSRPVPAIRDIPAFDCGRLRNDSGIIPGSLFTQVNRVVALGGC